jgi:hypothetical protein
MKALDFIKALGVAMATIVITLVASFPMVAFYAYVIEPGQAQDFYSEAAQWIAPWSSHILGPITLFCFNHWLARRSPERNAMLFAASTILLYALVDLSTLPMMGLPISSAFTLTIGLSFSVKAAGAFLGAYLGARQGLPGGAA